jgi:predicted secreted hydrolase
VLKTCPPIESLAAAGAADLSRTAWFVDHDVAPQRGAPAEWWYYNGHLRSRNRQYAFHVAFFRFCSSGFRIGRWLPLRLLGRHLGFAHVSLTDHLECLTRFAQRREFYHRDCFPEIRVKDWSIRLEPDQHRLRVGSEGCRLSLNLDPVKPLATYGPGGLFQSDVPRVSAHCSYPRMMVTGSIQVDGDDQPVEGTAWMDREYGVIGPDDTVAGWVWLSIQLDDGRELMIYRLQRRGVDDTCLKAAFIHPSGKVQVLADTEIEILPMRTWRSPATEAQYPVAWTVRVPEAAMTLTVDAIHDRPEFDTRGTTNTVYWEGPASVHGVQHGNPVRGNAFLELVGFDRKQLVGQMDHARRNLPLLGYFVNETRLRLWGSSRHLIQHGDSF